jgi:hypothetical protein
MFVAALLGASALTAYAVDPGGALQTAPWRQTEPAGFPPPAVSGLTVTTLDGRKLDLAAQPGWKVIYFWGAECPCVTACEQYSLVPMAERYKGKVTFYGVVSGGYDLGLAKSELAGDIKSRHLPYPVVLDPNHATARALDARVTPQTFVLDPQNRIVFAGMPDDSRRYIKLSKPGGVKHTYLSQALAQALAGKPVTTPTTEQEGCIIAW